VNRLKVEKAVRELQPSAFGLQPSAYPKD